MGGCGPVVNAGCGRSVTLKVLRQWLRSCVIHTTTIQKKEGILSEREILNTRLKEAREELGLTIEEIADRMAVSAKTIKNWELGRTTPRSNKLHTLSGILGVPFAWLLNGGTDQYAQTNRVGRIERVEQKLERMTQLRSQLSLLSAEITAEISEIRQTDEELKTLAA